jgi:hypothetical protein
MQLAPRALTEEINRYVDSLYPAYESGFLLVGGGIAEQPNRYVELVQLVGRTERKVQEQFDALNGDGEDQDD